MHRHDRNDNKPRCVTSIRELTCVCTCGIAVHGGDYWRLLTPGHYEITVSADGYEPQSQRVIVAAHPHEEAQTLDFWLTPQQATMPGFEFEDQPVVSDPPIKSCALMLIAVSINGRKGSLTP